MQDEEEHIKLSRAEEMNLIRLGMYALSDLKKEQLEEDVFRFQQGIY